MTSKVILSNNGKVELKIGDGALSEIGTYSKIDDNWYVAVLNDNHRVKAKRKDQLRTLILQHTLKGVKKKPHPLIERNEAARKDIDVIKFELSKVFLALNVIDTHINTTNTGTAVMSEVLRNRRDDMSKFNDIICHRDQELLDEWRMLKDLDLPNQEGD